MEGHQNVSSSIGHSVMNRSYYTGNSLSVSHSSQHVYVDSVPTSVHSPPTSQRLIDNTPSCSAIGPQLLHRNTGSPALAGPTRNVTGEAMPTSFDVALTQLSFMELVQRCDVLATPSQSTQLSVAISLADAAVQTAAPCGVSHDSSTQTSDQPGPSLSLDVAVQTTSCSASSSFLDAAVQTPSYSPLSQDVSTQFGYRTVSSFSVDVALPTSTHSVVLLDAATQLDLTEFLIGWIFSAVLWIIVIPFARHRQQCRAHMWYPCRRLDLNNQSLPPRLRLSRSRSPMPAALIALLCSRRQVPPTWEHTQLAMPVPRGVQVPPTRDPITLMVPALELRLLPSPNPTLWYSPCSTLGTPKPAAPVMSPQRTAISCIINFAFPSYSGIQARRAEIPPILSLLPVANSMQLFSRKPATMSRTSLIISLRTLTTRISPFCSTRTPLNQTLLSSRLRLNLRAKILGAWCYSSFVPCFVVRPFLDHLPSHFALHISTMLWPRNVTLPLNFYNSFTPKCWSSRLTS